MHCCREISRDLIRATKLWNILRKQKSRTIVQFCLYARFSYVRTVLWPSFSESPCLHLYPLSHRGQRSAKDWTGSEPVNASARARVLRDTYCQHDNTHTSDVDECLARNIVLDWVVLRSRLNVAHMYWYCRLRCSLSKSYYIVVLLPAHSTLCRECTATAENNYTSNVLCMKLVKMAGRCRYGQRFTMCCVWVWYCPYLTY